MTRVIICTRMKVISIPPTRSRAFDTESLNTRMTIPPYDEKHMTRNSIDKSCRPTPYISIFLGDRGAEKMLLTSLIEKKLVPELRPFSMMGMLMK